MKIRSILIASIFIFLSSIWTNLLAQQATITLANSSGLPGAAVVVPITVTTTSSIGFAQFVIEYNSSVLRFDSAQLGNAAGGFTLLTQTDLPFQATGAGTNENVLVQISSGTLAFTGANQEAVKLNFTVLGQNGQASPLRFDRDQLRTMLSELGGTDIASSNLAFNESTVTAGPPNIIVNGGFETGNTSGWQIVNQNGSSSVDNTTAAVGAYSFKAVIGTVGENWTATIYQLIPVDATKIYSLSFHAKASAPRNVAANLTENGNDWTWYGVWFQANLTTAWQQFQTTFTPSTTDPSANFVFLFGDELPDIWIDQVVIQEIGTVPPPTIDTFTPATSPAGTEVTITGSNFINVTQVKFNGVAVPPFTVVSNNEIRATVPADATTGTISVTTVTGTATSTNNFTVAPPNIIANAGFETGALSPWVAYAYTGGTVGIDNTTAVAGTYSFKAVITTPTPNDNSTTQLFQLIPIEVGAQYVLKFHAKASQPRQISINLTEFQNDWTWYGFFWDVNLTTSWQQFQTTFIPNSTDAQASLIFLLGAEGPDVWIDEVIIQKLLPPQPPIISDFSPTGGVIGNQVTITGSNFYGVTQVAFNGVAASVFTIDSNTRILANVPAGATTGKISVASSAGTDLSDNDFNVHVVPSLSINDVTVTEGNSGTVNAVFTVTLSTASSQQITVDYATANGTAEAGSDYVAIPTTQLIIPANTTTQTVTVQVIGDLLDEADETFFVNLSNATNAVITDNQGQGTITDDDPLPALSINDVSMAEGNSGTTTITFTVSLSAASGKQMAVDYATANGTATAGSDYVAIPTTQLIFPVGTTTQSVTVTVNGDALNEPDETFFVNLSNASNATISDGQGQGTIQNDDAIIIPTLSINDVTIIEGNSGTINAVFTVSLSTTSSQQITVDYTTANGTATGGSDYEAIPITQLIIPPNTPSQTITVKVNGDLFDESDETFLVNLANPTNATLADAQGLGTISDDDSPAQTITLNPTDDAFVNANQPTTNFGTATTLRMKQSSPITNSYLKFVVSGVSGPIQSAKIRMTVTVASSSGGSIYSVSNNYLGTSTPWIETGLNYNNAPAISGTPWDTEGSVTVGQVVELDVTPAITGNGTFSFGLKNSSTTTVQYSSEEGATKPQLVIQTGATFPNLSINDVTVTEGNVGNVNATFTASLSAPSSQVVTVSYSTADGTASAGSDYVSASGIVSFPIGTTTQSVTISVIGDAVVESNETFAINLSNSTNATIADAQGQATITDDDAVTITLNSTDDAYVNANQPTTNFGTQTTLRMRLSSPIINSYLKFTVNGVSGTVLSAKLRMTVTVASSSGGSIYSVSNNYLGTSTPWIETGLNYNNAPTISGTPWDSEGSVIVGQVVEFDVTSAITGNGMFSFGLKNSSTTTVQYSSDEGTTKPQLVIQFAPGPPSLSINDVTVLEGNSGSVNASFTVNLSAASNQVVSLNYTTANGTAAAGSDYVATSGSVTFPIGVTTQPIVVSVIGDILIESNETFFVNLSNPVNATIADAQGLGTITDDDIVTITLNPTDDAFVRSDQPTTNNGTATTLRMKQSSPIINSYLKFTVSGVSGTVSSAKLRLAVTVASSSGGSVYSVSNNLQGTSTPWTQSNLNYSNAPVISGTPLFTVGSVTVGQVVEFDVKAAITGNGTFSFGLNNASTTMVQYSSKEGATKPELVIQTGATSTAKILDLGTDSFTLESAEATTPLPKEFTLSANYPNPFNAQTVIEYALPQAVNVRLVIFNVLGQRIRQLVDENQVAGYKRLIWNGRNEFGTEVGSGIYFLQLNVGPQRFTRKIFLQR